MADGNKKAEELAKQIRETERLRRDPKVPANPDYREEKDK